MVAGLADCRRQPLMGEWMRMNYDGAAGSEESPIPQQSLYKECLLVWRLCGCVPPTTSQVTTAPTILGVYDALRQSEYSTCLVPSARSGVEQERHFVATCLSSVSPIDIDSSVFVRVLYHLSIAIIIQHVPRSNRIDEIDRIAYTNKQQQQRDCALLLLLCALEENVWEMGETISVFDCNSKSKF